MRIVRRRKHGTAQKGRGRKDSEPGAIRENKRRTPAPPNQGSSRFSEPHSHMASRIGMRDFPRSVRLFALEEGKNLLRGNGHASALLMAAEGSGFEDVVTYYDHLMEHLRWKNLGHVLAGGNMDAGDIQGKPELQMAFDLGKSIS